MFMDKLVALFCSSSLFCWLTGVRVWICLNCESFERWAYFPSARSRRDWGERPYNEGSPSSGSERKLHFVVFNCGIAFSWCEKCNEQSCKKATFAQVCNNACIFLRTDLNLIYSDIIIPYSAILLQLILTQILLEFCENFSTVSLFQKTL